MKLYSWNVNGLRAVLKRGDLTEFLTREQPDVVCLQEVKMKPEQMEAEIPGYMVIWNSAERAGYSGTAVLTKLAPMYAGNGFPLEIMQEYPWDEDKCGNALIEGRVQTIEFAEFYLVNVYVPNSKPGLERLAVREQMWDPALLRYLKFLEQSKPVVVCGDFNAAHTALDLARPKENEHHAGYTEEERLGIRNLVGAGFVDTYRHFYPAQQKYSWWSHWGHARERNVGWRIDYFFVSSALVPKLAAAEIHDYIMGSDHAPVSIELEIN